MMKEGNGADAWAMMETRWQRVNKTYAVRGQMCASGSGAFGKERVHLQVTRGGGKERPKRARRGNIAPGTQGARQYVLTSLVVNESGISKGVIQENERMMSGYRGTARRVSGGYKSE